MNYFNILSISDDRRWLVIYIILMGILAFVAFGHLSNHPLDGDDFEYIDDAAAAIQNPSHLFSTDNKLPGRPFVDAVFFVAHILWDKNPAAYHALLIGLHLLASIRLVQTFGLFGSSAPVSMIGGAFFCSKPAAFAMYSGYRVWDIRLH